MTTDTRIAHGPRPSLDPAPQPGSGNSSSARGAVHASPQQQPGVLLSGLQRPAPMPGARREFNASGSAPNLRDVLVPAGTAPRTALRQPAAPYPPRPASTPPYPHDPLPNASPGRPRAHSMPGPARERLSMPDPADYRPGGRFATGPGGGPRPMQAYAGAPQSAPSHPVATPAHQAPHPTQPAPARPPQRPTGSAPGHPVVPMPLMAVAGPRIGSATQLLRKAGQAMRSFASAWTRTADTVSTASEIVSASQSRRQARMDRYAQDSAPEAPLTGGYGDGRFDRR